MRRRLLAALFLALPVAACGDGGPCPADGGVGNAAAADGGGGEADAGPGPCSADEDCPPPEDASACLASRCRAGSCYEEDAPPGSHCSWQVGQYTCPGNCPGFGGPCQELEPHCGGF